MKRWIWIILLFSMMHPAAGSAKEFLGVPLMGSAKVKSETEKRIEMTIGVSHQEVLDFYKNVFKDTKDIKFRDWKHDTYIEDDSALPWHSITISKIPRSDGTLITIVKDSWTWIIGTLLLRFIAVFVVLLVLYVAMNMSGKMISRAVKRKAAAKAS